MIIRLRRFRELADLTSLAALPGNEHVAAMTKRKRMKAVPLPVMMAELTFASWETIARRTWMMAQGTCSPAEYRRMVHEKAQAVYRPRFLRHRIGAYAASAAMESWASRMALGGRKPCRSISQVAL